MLHFFRQIPKTLLEQNKVWSYIFYTIGEILLVVIGILIALQINTWNENRKDVKLRKSYNNALLSDFKADTSRIQQYLNRLLKWIPAMSMLRNCLRIENSIQPCHPG